MLLFPFFPLKFLKIYKSVHYLVNRLLPCSTIKNVNEDRHHDIVHKKQEQEATENYSDFLITQTFAVQKLNNLF